MSIRLQPDKVVATVEKLQRRIHERFPGSGLLGLCGRLLEVARESEARALAASKPILGLRVGIGLLVVLLIGGVLVTVANVEIPREPVDLALLVQLLESGINDLVFIGIAIAFVVTLETRIKRHRALAAIHDLRALAHIIDMHQLTKAPGHPAGEGTASSPARVLTPFQLRRYLDYCSEMLAITGKIAALYVQDFDDEVVLAAVNEVEDLSTGLSRKIWQKIMVLDASEVTKPAVAPQQRGDDLLGQPLDD